MSNLEIRIDLSGIDRLRRELSPPALAARGRAAMRESLAFVQTEVQKETPVYLNTLRGGTFTELRGTALEDLRGRVAPPEAARDYAGVVEFGRRPGGKMPPVSAIEGWVSRKLPGASAFVVARAIARKGTRPRHMFTNAAEKARRVVPEIWARHFRI